MHVMYHIYTYACGTRMVTNKAGCTSKTIQGDMKVVPRIAMLVGCIFPQKAALNHCLY